MTDPQQFVSPQPPAKRQGLSKGCVIAIVVSAVVGVAGIAVLVGAAFFFIKFGLDVVADQIRRDIQDNPVILEQVGAIESIEVDFVASANEPSDKAFVFNIEGPNGSGLLTVSSETIDGYTEKVVWGQLRVASGETYDLFPDQGPKPY